MSRSSLRSYTLIERQLFLFTITCIVSVTLKTYSVIVSVCVSASLMHVGSPYSSSVWINQGILSSDVL